LIGALLVGADCDAYCSTIVRSSPADMGGMRHCPQHPQNHGRPDHPCFHRHYELAGPESGPDLVNHSGRTIVQLPLVLLDPQMPSFVKAREVWIKLDPAPPPPASALLTISVLRI
jgi:hypothetical protein